ncbi:sigma-54-dependent Fis family transcriptional regulator [Clostridium gasigenes]|uniref:Regulatory protein, Fis family n=1 Tax=Clostridium gasigenes TaxID=94869 RepID=A0A1H0UXB1_9CLOT|nr:sigma 54-interacting transcriptional regulator [Clostridium gasigenes]MBB6624066.1 sigma 54-interacting transcriptional regulator [Clostridium gasigenes]MBU3088313.1 sigma 54-interacting transcriptional regulator [Clostridium gasigenes]SDP70817.1 regulatory protein, Fis family [Clostridium gasigenes]
MLDNKLLVKESHKRSKGYGVLKESIYSKKILENEELLRILSNNSELIEISRPYIDMMFSSVHDNDFIIVLTDKEGCILNIKGAEWIVNKFDKLNLKIGAYMDEQNIGTNAMGTAIKEDKCVQITANEHYIESFRSLTCSAAPIHNIYGKIIGTLNLTGKSNMKHPHTLGLVAFGVKAIENNLDKCKNDTKGAFCDFNDIIGKSAAITNVITNCKIIANSPSTVLIQGESGTGKEVLAQAIHNYSYRRKNKFVAINCGAIPANLIESELFGYEEGTFTGGKKGGKIGKVEIANGGTLFLDEIGEMPLEMQVNLLRVLQEGVITRLGGSEEIPVDIRVIAATNKNLKKQIEKREFREDLYYRLCVIPIKIPPLRERNGDIEELIEYFLRKKSFKLNKVVPEINNELYKDLVNYNWPGNIRQLENYIENIVNLGGKLSFDLSEDNESSKEIYSCIGIIRDEIEKSRVDINILEKDLNLEIIEARTIDTAMKVNNYNITKVAIVLGISRNTLYNKIKKYNIKSK